MSTSLRCALLMSAALLAACAASIPTAAPTTASVVISEPAAAVQAAPAKPVLNNTVLPSLQRNGTVTEPTALLERPKPSSVITTTLPAGTALRVLGDLNNSDGQWLSVSFGDTQGWIHAAQLVQQAPQ